MRKLLFAAALVIGLGGCAQLQEALQAGKLITASYSNPVTPTRLAELENSLTIAFAVLNAYKKSCVAGAVETHCRANIAAIQVYTRRVPPLLTSLRTFVKTNDQVNAITAYNQIKDLVTAWRSTAMAAGIPTGGL